jgi:DNA-nicking Smr family endonuclease
LNDNISDKDKKDWQTFISSKEKILDKDFKPQIKNHLKIKSIDLHGYTLEQANNAIEKFILKAFEEEVNKLIVVTGKGIHSDVEKDPYVSKDLSILKYSVPEFVNKNQNLMRVINDIQDATIEDGGSGAFYILLKKKRSIK